MLPLTKKEFMRIDAKGRLMGTRINTTRLPQGRAEIAGHCFSFNDGKGDGHTPRGASTRHLELMHIDIAVRTLRRTLPASNAPVLDDDLQGFSPTD